MTKNMIYNMNIPSKTNNNNNYEKIEPKSIK